MPRHDRDIPYIDLPVRAWLAAPTLTGTLAHCDGRDAPAMVPLYDWRLLVCPAALDNSQEWAELEEESPY